MIKAKKGLLIALFAAMMVFAFGATSAFASDTDGGHTYVTNASRVSVDTEGLKVLVEPTCTTDGVGELTCITDLNGEPCGHVKTVKIQNLGHKSTQQVRMTISELMDYFQLSEKAKEAYLNEHPTWCEKYVYVCDNCGALVYNPYGNTWNAYTSINDILDTTANPWVKHTAPSDIKKCAETFTCTECGMEGCPNTSADAGKHTWAEPAQVQKAHIIKNGADEVAYVYTETKTCTECGKVQTGEPTPWGEYARAENPRAIVHGATTRVDVPSDEPCKTPSGYKDICNDCGMEVSSGQSPLAAHTWVTSVAESGKDAKTANPGAQDADGKALIDDLMYTHEYCVVCKQIKAKSYVAVGFEPDPAEGTVSYEAASNANCEQGAFIIATNTSAAGVVTKNVLSDTQVDEAIANKTFVKIGDKYYNASKKVEVPYTEKTKHKFGQTTKVAEPTCTERGIEAKVCENCQKIDHSTMHYTDKALGHEVKPVKVDATCGDFGYTYNICTRCNEYISKDGKTEKYEEYDTVKPVVALGTECSYAWKVLEEATPFALGTRAKVCTVCNHELEATKESIAKTTIAAPAVKAKKGKKAVVTVKAVEGAVSYQILVNGKVKVKNAKVGKNTVKKLTGKKAKVQIKAFDANGVAAKSKAKTVKVKK